MPEAQAAAAEAAPRPSEGVAQRGAAPQERLKAFFTPEEPPGEGDVAPTETHEAAKEVSTAPLETKEVDDAPDKTDAPKDEEKSEPEGDADEEPAQLSTVQDLADATGLDLDKILALELPTKVDGKEGTAPIRELLKSYQLQEHINNKLSALDTDRKTFETKRQETEKATADRLLRLDAGLKTLERALLGEFATIDWQALQADDPLEFNAKYVSYQQRYAQLQDIGKQIAAEQAKAKGEQEAKMKAWLDEQRSLLKAKVPEWSDDSKRTKDRADMLDYLKSHGVSEDEFNALADHRFALIIRDGWKWQQLQKTKPATLQKVRTAPKLLKQGTQQSEAAKDNLALKNARDRLKQSGKIRDAVGALKHFM